MRLASLRGLAITTMLSGLAIHGSARGQTEGNSSERTKSVSHVKTGSAKALPPQGLGVSATREEAISVTARRNLPPGGGMMRVENASHAVQSVTQDFIEMQSPTSAPLDLIRSLPSVNVSSSDPSGIDGGSISSRGLNDTDIGFVMNGMPIANGSTSSASGFLQNYIDSENIAAESMSPGSSGVADPVTSASAGLMRITTRDPSERFGGKISASYGTFNTTKQFVRVDTGEIGHSGVTSYLSLSHTRADAWRGSGVSDRKHLDFRLRKTIGAHSTIDFMLGYNHASYFLNRYPTKANFEASRDGGIPTIAINYLANPSPSSPSSYYRVHGQEKDQFYASLPVNLRLNSLLSVVLTPYYQRSAITLNSATRLTEGSTYYGTQRVSLDLNGDGRVRSSTSVNVSTPAMSLNQQGGLVAALKWALPDNNGQAGYWYERNSYALKTPVASMGQSDESQYRDDNASSYYRLSDGSIFYSTNYVGQYQVHSGFVEDTQYFLHHKMLVTGSFKLVGMSLSGKNNLPGPNPETHNSFVSPMPHLSWSWTLARRHQIYVNAEGDFRAPAPAGLITRTSLTSGAVTTSGSNVKPQYSIKEELGYRYKGSLFLADVSLYNLNITNRLLSLNAFSNNVQVTEVLNAGGETIRGVDVMLSTRPIWHRFSPYVSFEYLHATMDNNLPATATNGTVDYLRTRGKVPVLTPHFMGSVGLTYNEGPLFLNLNLHYTGKQYSTFINDESLPHYFTNSLSLGYHFPKFYIAQSPTLRLNFSNMTSTNKLSGVYSFSDNAKATTGVLGKKIASDGSPLYYPMPSFSMIGTISTSF